MLIDDNRQIVTIKVFEKPESMDEAQNDQTETYIASTKDTFRHVGIGNIKVENGETHHNCTVQLSLPTTINESYLESLRLHVISSSFIYKFDPLREIRVTHRNRNNPLPVSDIVGKKSTYLNNKALSDEHCYVLSRQTQEKAIGNNLEKPRVLLKRLEKRETTFGEEELSKAGEFKRLAQKEKAMDMMMDHCAPMSSTNTALYRAFPGNAHLASCPPPNGITSRNNFLRHSSEVQCNLHGLNISFKVPIHHSSVKLILASQSFAV